MAEKRSYWELLKDPRWQKKRLQILSLFNFSCEQCGATDKTLHVHHSYYEKGLMPWEYPDSSLHSLCDQCHKAAQNTLLALHQTIGNLSLGEIERLHGYAQGLSAESYPDTIVQVYSFEVALGVAGVWDLTAEQVIKALDEQILDGWTLSEMKKANQQERGK